MLRASLPVYPDQRTASGYPIGRDSNLALNRYAVGSRPADREVARPREYEIRLFSTAFPMSALPRIATTERPCQHVSNVPDSEVARRSRAHTFCISQIPIAECAAFSAPHRPRVLSLAAFGRRPTVYVAPMSLAGIRNPQQTRKYSLRPHRVRFAPESGLKSDIAGGPFSANGLNRSRGSLPLPATQPTR